ncbi:MAG TPA: hypothetical protein VGS03_18445 [Candidatus Polarisedimenticolia bacterium]|nr:hypothetical protein [Candidatus Polarisedimenticolia bacterium]
MIDHLSPREMEMLEAARAAGEAWPAVVRRFFLEGSRLLLGWDRARGEEEMRAALAAGPADAERDVALPQTLTKHQLRAALEKAARFCTEHGLHFLSFEGSGPGEEPLGERRWFMAVG